MCSRTLSFRGVREGDGILFVEASTLLDIVLCDMASVIVLNDLDFNVLGNRWHGSSEPESRAPKNVVPAYCPIFHDESTMEIRYEPKNADDDGDTSDTKDRT